MLLSFRAIALGLLLFAAPSPFAEAQGRDSARGATATRRGERSSPAAAAVPRAHPPPLPSVEPGEPHEPADVPAGEVPEPARSFGLFRNAGREPIALYRSTNPPRGEQDVVYLARPGEVIALDRQADDRGWRLGDVWRQRGPEMALDFPTFARGDALREVSPAPLAGASASPPAANAGLVAYVDVEDGAKARLFAAPGYTDRDCGINAARCRDSLPDGAQIRILESRLVSFEDLAGNRRTGNFYLVEARRTNGRATVGWIESHQTRSEAAQRPPHAETDEECAEPEALRTAPPANALANIRRRASRAASEAIADALSGDLGECLLKPDQIPRGNPGPIPSRSAYAEILGPHWKSRSVPAINGLDGKALERRQLEAIDVAARMIYAEMAGCGAQHGHYLTAVGGIAAQRAIAVEQNPAFRRLFAGAEPEEGRHPITDVFISPMQFSPLNRNRLVVRTIRASGGSPRRTTVEEANPALRTLLCPPSRAGQAHAHGVRPTPVENETWKKSMRVAAHLVLAREDFVSRLRFTARSFTSGEEPTIPGHVVAPTGYADGRPIDNPNCMRLWAPQPSAARTAAK